jgi:hypothetical protein
MRVPRPERRAVTIAALLATLALGGAPAAQADVGGEIISRCLNHQSLSGFTQADYSKALKELTATAEEYSDCGQEIQRAQTAAASSHTSGSGPGGPSSAAPVGAIAATPSEQRAIERAARSGGGPVSLGDGLVVHPGVVQADVGSAFSTLPGPLLAVLALMLAGLLGLGANVLRKRVRGERPD